MQEASVKKAILSWIVSLMAAGILFSQDVKLRPMTIDDSLNMIRLGDVQMSPDGKWVFFSKSALDWEKNKRKKSFFLIPANGGEARPFIGDAGGSDFQFSPDGTYLSFKRPAEETKQVFVMSLVGGEAVQLTHHTNDIEAYKWSPDARQIFFTSEEPMGEEEKREYDLGDDVVFVYEAPNGRERESWKNLWLIDVATKEETRITDEELVIDEFDISSDGRHVVFAATELEDENYFFLSELYWLDVSEETLSKLTNNQAPEGELLWSPGGETFVYHAPSSTENDLSHGFLWIMNPRTGERRKLERPNQGGISGLAWTPDGESLLFNETRRTSRNLHRLNIETGGITDVTNVDGSLRALAYSKDRTRMVYSYSDCVTPPDLYASALSEIEPVRLTDVNPWIMKEILLADCEAVRWKSKDGMEIEGVLYVPADAKADERLPLMVTIHGGPPGHFADRFRAEFQLYTGLGYAVFGPNIRGSDSYGDDLLRALQGDVGGGEFDDVMSGVDYLIASGIADSKRLGVRGWSWGGILGSWVITQTDRFQAAALGAMVGSWTAETGPGLFWDLRYHYIEGAHWTNPEDWRRVSSLWYVNNVTTPTLLIHGEKDLVSTSNQALMFCYALKEIGKAPVRYIKFPREGHGLREPRHQRRRYVEEIRWMEKHIRGIDWDPWKRE